MSSSPGWASSHPSATTPRKCWRACARRNPASCAADKYAELGFRCQVHGAPTLVAEEVVDRRAMRFLGGGTAWNHVAMEQAIPDAGLEHERSLERAHRHHHGLRRALDPRHRRGRRHHARKGPKRVGPFAVPKAMCSTASRDARHLVQDQGRELFDLARPARPRPTASATPTRRSSWGKQDVIFAGGCEELDWTLSVLFDAMGAMSSKYNDTPADSLARLRREPRRLRHRRRRRRAGAGRTRARQGARREDLRRDRRLRRHLATATTWWRPRAKARRAACRWRSRRQARRSTTSTRTPPRRRSAT